MRWPARDATPQNSSLTVPSCADSLCGQSVYMHQPILYDGTHGNKTGIEHNKRNRVHSVFNKQLPQSSNPSATTATVTTTTITILIARSRCHLHSHQQHHHQQHHHHHQHRAHQHHHHDHQSQPPSPSSSPPPASASASASFYK